MFTHILGVWIFNHSDMGWLRWVGCLKIQVSLQNTGLFCRALLQKRPIFLSILLFKHSDISHLKSFAITFFNRVSLWYPLKYCVVKSFLTLIFYIFTHFRLYFPIFDHSDVSSFQFYHHWVMVCPFSSYSMNECYSFTQYPSLISASLTQTCATYSTVPITSPGSNFTHFAWFKSLCYSLFWYSLKHVRHTQTYNWLGSFSLLLIFPDLSSCIIRYSDLRSSMCDLLHNTNSLVLFHVYSLLFGHVY